MRNFFIVLCTLALASLVSCSRPNVSEDDIPETESVTEITQFGLPIDSFDVKDFQIRSGENLSLIFKNLGFTASMSESISKVSSSVLDATKLRAGLTYHTFSSKDSTQTIKYIVFGKSQIEFAVIDLSGDSVTAYPFQKEITLKRKMVSGTITSSLWNAIRQAGGDPLLALKLSDIYGWEIDFFDVKQGDSFATIYNEAYVDDSVALYIESIESARFVHRDRTFNALPFTQDGITEYFDESGKSLRKAFLKAPLDFFRITSKFSNGRMHPVLKIVRPHHGIDYAAPVGTPVKTIGAGTVIAKGYEMGGGNYIKVRHNSVYTTTYMHLSKFGAGIKQGSTVQQGQVIGYVGSTGLSTGPHLDFRVHKNGRAINPQTMEAPPSNPIAEAARDSFNIVSGALIAELERYQPQSGEPILIAIADTTMESGAGTARKHAMN
ncbi:MAG: M23 family metallopeptidase [Bacteroidales bacterium]